MFKFRKRHAVWYAFQLMFSVILTWNGVVSFRLGDWDKVALAILGMSLVAIGFHTFRYYADIANEEYD